VARRTGSHGDRATLDETDLKIIRLLQANGRTSNTEISRALSVTEATVRNRVSRLLDEELITISAVPTPKALGANLSAIIGVSVELPQMRAVADTLITYQETRYVGLSTGRYDLIVEAVCTDQEHLLQFITSSIGELAGVKSVETSLILNVAKRSFLVI
jgi:Lrp/AsnC family transcriptional regulator for asnA, asnC and gidA